MSVVSRNISSLLRDALANHLLTDSYIQSTFTKKGSAYIYDKPFETVTISKYPAMTVYDALARDYSYNEPFYRNVEELFKIEVASQNVDWTVAKNDCSLYIDTIEMLLDQKPWVDMSIPINTITIEGVKPIGSLEINRLWTMMAEMDIIIEYEKGFEPDN